MSSLLNASSLDAAQELLHTSGCTDGLPVIVPTLDKVARMVLASGLDADIELEDEYIDDARGPIAQMQEAISLAWRVLVVWGVALALFVLAGKIG